MKLIEIGDGLKTINVPDKYYSDWEDTQTVLLYTDEDNDIGIRVSVISVEPKDKSDANHVFNTVIKNGKEEGSEVIIKNDKSYYITVDDSTEEGTFIHFFFIGYKWNYIVISVAAPIEKKDSKEVKEILQEIEQIIPTITEVTEKDRTIFEPKYTDYKGINERISAVLNIKEDDIDKMHEDKRTLDLIQEILDTAKYGADKTSELQSLGLAMGDYIQYKNKNFHWAVIRDEYGRDLCLQYQNIKLTIFPLTMISKRVEDGEIFSVKSLVNGLFNSVNEWLKNNDLKQLN